MTKYRWNPYVLIKGEKTITFWNDHFNCDRKSRNLLFVLGKGFDVRMNFAIKQITECCPEMQMECMLIDFEESRVSYSHNYKSLVDENMDELSKIVVNKKQLIDRKIVLWKTSGRKRRRIGDRQAALIFKDIEEVTKFSDIIIDISALPRGVYFSLIGKVLSLIDKIEAKVKPNLFVIVAENAEIDKMIIDDGIDNDLNYLYGFGGQIDLSSEIEKPIIWFPILGEDKAPHLSRAYSKITETKNRLFEICPTLPFPSKNPRRSEALIIEYHKLLFDEFGVEPQNIMYVPEQNPFEVYLRLCDAITNYNKSLKVINGCKASISTFSSKLLSIGTLLAAFELKDDIGVGILNVDAEGYRIKSVEDLKKLNEKSELFVTWLTGEPY